MNKDRAYGHLNYYRNLVCVVADCYWKNALKHDRAGIRTLSEWRPEIEHLPGVSLDLIALSGQMGTSCQITGLKQSIDLYQQSIQSLSCPPERITPEELIYCVAQLHDDYRSFLWNGSNSSGVVLGRIKLLEELSSYAKSSGVDDFSHVPESIPQFQGDVIRVAKLYGELSFIAVSNDLRCIR